jgi:HD-GYP domain-containing protein (c-di-GMP phosphodiesterase class II)
MEKNWLLHQELEGKKEVENLNNQLQKKIRLQSLMFNIVDSLSHINQSEDLYHYLVEKSVESCNATRACFMIHDQENSNLLVLAQKGLDNIELGLKTDLKNHPDGQKTLDKKFIEKYFKELIKNHIKLDKISRINGFMALPFNIRNEPFGLLLLAGKAGEKSFDKEDEFILKFLAEKAALNIENIALYDNLKQSLMASLMSLVSAIEAKDTYTQQHSSRVTDYAIKIAKAMNCNHSDIQKLDTSAPLHDIGKIGINDSILNKPDRLTDEEYDQIKAHPLIGENIVMPLGLDNEELAIIRNHHERWDGRGYPDGLKEKDIPKLSRILAVADSFDAMNSSRAYRKALPFSICVEELEKNKGSQFDPDVVDAALSVFSELE